MKSKKLSFKVIEEDIRPVASAVVGGATNRLTKGYQEAARKLNGLLSTGNSLEILESLQELVDLLETAVKELEQCGEVVSQIPDLPEEDSEESSEKK